MKRRVFLESITALAAAGIPMIGKADVSVSEVPFRRNAAGRQLMARIYHPSAQGKNAGPFPVLLDLHGGAWTRKDRTANEPMDRAIAAGGVLVVAIDLTLAGEAPYPASVQDASYGVRWLKARAREWQGDAATLGLLGSSSGGHIAELIGMRPGFPLYNRVSSVDLGQFDDSVAYVATRSPISDPYARWQQAERLKRENLISASKTYFRPWEAIHEGNPQAILDRKEQVTLRPLLIMQGELDDNVLPAVQQTFAESYRRAGGKCRLEIFEGSEHEWVAKPGAQTDRAHAMVKAFIAEQLRNRGQDRISS